MKPLFGIILFAAWALAAASGPGRPGVLVTRAWLVPVEDSGRLEVVPGARPAEASEILYTIRFRYDGEVAAEGLEIVQRVPAGTRYVAGSATGPGAVVTFSVDDGQVFDLPGALGVPGADGEDRPATADDYTHLRWLLPGRFPPGTGGVLSFRARPLESDTADSSPVPSGPDAEPAAPDEGR